MTIKKAIDKADRLRPNQYSEIEKVEWLSHFDKRVFQEVLLMAEENQGMEFAGYDENTNIETELLIDDVYADTYIEYLIAKYDYFNREMGMYNNSAVMFNNSYQEYKNWYRSTHMPVQPSGRGV